MYAIDKFDLRINETTTVQLSKNASIFNVQVNGITATVWYFYIEEYIIHNGRTCLKDEAQIIDRYFEVHKTDRLLYCNGNIKVYEGIIYEKI